MWSEIVGHRHPLEQLTRTLKGERLHHAYLFTGIEGIGKRKVALILAKTLIGAREKTFLPDLHLITPEKNRIKIDQLRELKRKIFLYPAEGKAKVVIIDPAESMTDTAANALLKILEEPPADTYFILISAQPMRLLPTIRSRCQTLGFTPLSEEEVITLFQKNTVPQEEWKERARYAGGSVARGLEFNPSLFASVRQDIGSLLQQPSPSHILALTEKWLEEEENISFLFQTLTHLWQEKLLAAASTEEAEKCACQWKAIQNGQTAWENHANKQLLLEQLLFTLTER